MSGLETSQQACEVLTEMGGNVYCHSGIYYQKFKNKMATITNLTTDDPKLKDYFEKANVCCWN